MTMLLRAVLIVVSVATTWMILRKIRTSKCGSRIPYSGSAFS